VNEFWFFVEVFFVLSLNVFAFVLGKRWLFAIVCIEIVLMNIFVLVQFKLFGFDVTGGNVLYAGVFLSTDLVSEYWGKKDAKKLVLMGFCVSAFYIFLTQIFVRFTPNDFDGGMMNNLKSVFLFSPRIVFASMFSYLIVQNYDIFIFSFLKKKFSGKFLWLRNNVSTISSQFLDTFIFTVFGLLQFSFLNGILSSDVFVSVLIATFIIKFIVSVLDTPFIYFGIYLKKRFCLEK